MLNKDSVYYIVYKAIGVYTGLSLCVLLGWCIVEWVMGV